MTNNVTPADVEFVPATSIAVTDVLVTNFHTRRQHADEAPTARQLARATFISVNSIVTSNGVVIDFNADDTPNRVTALATTNVWRVKR